MQSRINNLGVMGFTAIFSKKLVGFFVVVFEFSDLEIAEKFGKNFKRLRPRFCRYLALFLNKNGDFLVIIKICIEMIRVNISVNFQLVINSVE